MAHPSATARFAALLRAERGDLTVLAVYTLAVAGLTLTVPLAMQALVNTVSAGILLQPVVVLTILVLVGLLVAAALQALQVGIVETLQQRVFARTALQVADRLARVRASELRRAYAPELANRFFDVLTVQKALSKLLLDGLGAATQAVVAVVVLALFSPSLLLVAGLIVLLFAVGAFALGVGGLRTSVEESAAKYRVAGWLEELARGHVAAKLHGDAGHLQERTDAAVCDYLDAREAHFRVCRRQLVGFLVLAALAQAGLLAVGGWLVLDGGLTLGQFVAAQIVVALVLASLDKLTRQNEKLYDLLTGLEKVGHLVDLQSEREGGQALPARWGDGGASVVCRGVRFGYDHLRPVLDGLDLTLEPGARVSLVGGNGAGKSTLVALLCGLETPQEGTVEIDGVDVRGADLASLRRAVALVTDERDLFSGTVRENVALGRPHVGPDEVAWAARLAGLDDLPDGLETPVVSGAGNLSRGLAQRILIARAVADRPRLLILDEGLAGIEERAAVGILERILDPANGWTVIDVSHEPDIVARANTVCVLAEGRVVAKGAPRETAHTAEFSRLFPYLSRTLRSEGAGSLPHSGGGGQGGGPTSSPNEPVAAGWFAPAEGSSTPFSVPESPTPEGSQKVAGGRRPPEGAPTSSTPEGSHDANSPTSAPKGRPNTAQGASPGSDDPFDPVALKGRPTLEVSPTLAPQNPTTNDPSPSEGGGKPETPEVNDR